MPTIATGSCVCSRASRRSRRASCRSRRVSCRSTVTRFRYSSSFSSSSAIIASREVGRGSIWASSLRIELLRFLWIESLVDQVEDLIRGRRANPLECRLTILRTLRIAHLREQLLKPCGDPRALSLIGVARKYAVQLAELRLAQRLRRGRGFGDLAHQIASKRNRVGVVEYECRGKTCSGHRGEPVAQFDGRERIEPHLVEWLLWLDCVWR